MMKGKKIITAVALVLITSGSAFAAHGAAYGPGGMCFAEGPGAGMHMRGPGRFENIPAEVQTKLDSIRSANAEIRTELSKEKPDNAKARSLHENVIKLKQEVADYRFEEQLKNPSGVRNDPSRREGRMRDAGGNNEMRTLRTQMFEELKKEKVDAAKVREIHGKIGALTATHSRTRFEDILKSPSAYLNGPHHGFRGDERMGRGPGAREFSEADRAKFEQIRTLNDEIRSEMQKSTRDEAKLRELHKQVQSLHNEFSDVRFEEALKAPKPIQ